ncbi:hypothetical protein D7024_03120 [Desulfofundulus salinus]|uniref:Uncharacterized protein n=1 Tax=Desulfofundulus salinus TaxID=2419843 RepID=A0A494WZP6_9FIRM|nr:hypothetical protein D7024_03120 [Desulfofundulus salinum]
MIHLLYVGPIAPPGYNIVPELCSCTIILKLVYSIYHKYLKRKGLFDKFFALEKTPYRCIPGRAIRRMVTKPV